jgi:hypothetical protein
MTATNLADGVISLFSRRYWWAFKNENIEKGGLVNCCYGQEIEKLPENLTPMLILLENYVL